jgi:hypothetical protein
MPRGGEYDHFKFLKQKQRLNHLSVLPMWCRYYRGPQYYWYQVGTTDRVELTKTKFEFCRDSSKSI